MRGTERESSGGRPGLWLRIADQALSESPPLAPCHTSSHALVFRLNPPVYGLERIHYLKVFPRRTCKDRFKDACRGSPVQRVLRGNRLLRKEGFLVPQVVAVGELEAGAWSPASFLMEKGLDGLPLPVYLEASVLSGSCSFRDRRGILERLAFLVNRMHRSGIVHGDLHGGNILVCGPSEGQASPWIAFLDTLRTRRPALRRIRWVLQDLRQLNQILPPVVSWSERLDFLRRYLPGSPLEDMDPRALIERLVRMSEERLARKGRSLKERWDPGKKRTAAGQ